MGDYAEDLKNDFELEFNERHGFVEPIIMIPLESEFEVSIIHLKTGICYWTGIVTASSKKDAQRQFRKEYSHIRNQYTHEYGLGIKLLK